MSTTTTLGGPDSRRAWTHPAPGVAVTHSRLDHTASIVLSRETVDGPLALVVDPAWTPAELHDLAHDVHASGLTVVAGFATHAHYDHVLWHPGLGQVPRWASAVTVELASVHAEDNRAALRASSPGWEEELLALAGALVPLPGPQTRERWAGPGLQGWGEVITHDAHSPGHSALWLPGRRVLIAGDMLSDVEIPMLSETGARAYGRGLAALRPYAQEARVLIPGHGTPAQEAADRWEADQRYLDDLLAGRTPADDRMKNPVNQRHHADNLAALER